MVDQPLIGADDAVDSAVRSFDTSSTDSSRLHPRMGRQCREGDTCLPGELSLRTLRVRDSSAPTSTWYSAESACSACVTGSARVDGQHNSRASRDHPRRFAIRCPHVPPTPTLLMVAAQSWPMLLWVDRVGVVPDSFRSDGDLTVGRCPRASEVMRCRRDALRDTDDRRRKFGGAASFLRRIHRRRDGRRSSELGHRGHVHVNQIDVCTWVCRHA